MLLRSIFFVIVCHRTECNDWTVYMSIIANEHKYLATQQPVTSNVVNSHTEIRFHVLRACLCIYANALSEESWN